MGGKDILERKKMVKSPMISNSKRPAAHHPGCPVKDYNVFIKIEIGAFYVSLLGKEATRMMLF